MENKIIQAKFVAIQKALSAFAYDESDFTTEDAREFHAKLVSLGYVVIKL